MRLLRVAALVWLLARLASADELINFDNFILPGTTVQTQILNGSYLLDWTNFGVLNSTRGPNPSGYVNGATSGTNVAFDYAGNPAGFGNFMGTNQAFDLVSAELTGAFDNGLNIEVKGFSGNTLVYDNTYTVNESGPTLVNFHYDNITSVTFTPSGGTSAIQGHPSSEIFAIDDIQLVQPDSDGSDHGDHAPVPDSGSTALLLSAALGSLPLLRRKA